MPAGSSPSTHALGIAFDLFCATNGDTGKTAGVPVVSREDSMDAFMTSPVDVERLAFAAGVPQPRPMIDDLFDGL